ncbi:MAG: hypothetical protein J6K88_04980 [Oscillospiraceae bacterium]|nr:hypothetical protein [Oscillospiraceae bacterium]
MLICIISVFVVSFVNNVVMSGEYVALNIIVSALILTLTNFALIKLQGKNEDGHKKDQHITKDSDKKAPDSKKNLILIATIAIIIMIVFCSTALPFFVRGIKEHFNNAIDDTNGPNNYMLNTIKREDILSDDNEYTMLWSGESQKGNQSNVEKWYLKDYDYDKVSLQAETLSGVRIMQSTKVNENQLVLNITSNVEKGNFEIAILIDGEYYKSVDINQTEEIILNDIANKTVLIKIAGESAKFRIEIQRSRI